MKRTCALYSYNILCTCLLENNAFSVMHYVEKVTLHCLVLHRFEIHSLPWNFCARLYYAAAWQPRVFAKTRGGNHRDRPAGKLGQWLYLCLNKYKLCCSKWIYMPTFLGSETLLGVNSLLARVSVRGYLSLQSRRFLTKTRRYIETTHFHQLLFLIKSLQHIFEVRYVTSLLPAWAIFITLDDNRMIFTLRNYTG